MMANVDAALHAILGAFQLVYLRPLEETLLTEHYSWAPPCLSCTPLFGGFAIGANTPAINDVGCVPDKPGKQWLIALQSALVAMFDV